MDLHNLVCDPATLVVAWHRVRGNRGSRTAGVDGTSARDVERSGVVSFLSGCGSSFATAATGRCRSENA